MPGKRKRSYKYGRKVRRRLYKKKRSATIRRAPGLLGKKFRQPFRYVDRISLDPTGIAAATYSFRANSLYDPDFTGVGHQPIGFDQLMPFYEHYTVIAARIKCTFICKSAAATQCAIVGIETNSGSTPTTAINDIYEQGNSSKKIMTCATAGQKVTVTRKLSVGKFLSQKVMQEDANAGTATSNPSELIFFHLFATNTDGSTDIAAMDVLVELDQIAILHEPKPLGGS